MRSANESHEYKKYIRFSIYILEILISKKLPFRKALEFQYNIQIITTYLSYPRQIRHTVIYKSSRSKKFVFH